MTICSYFSISVALFILGCANTSTSWRESVLSADQHVITLDRAETRWAQASSSLPGSGYPESQYFSASVPNLGDVVWQEGSGYSQPIAFDVVDGVPWLIQENDGPCQRNPTPESMRIFRYFNGKWEQVRLADAPKKLASNLTMYSSPKSRGQLGTRSYYGTCDVSRPKDYSSINNPEAFTSLAFRADCGQTLEALQDSLLTSRNCASKGYPLSPSFPAKWEAFQREPIRKQKATVVNENVTPPALPVFALGDKNRFYVPPSMFKCIIGCRKDELTQIATYVPPHNVDQKGYTTWDGSSIYEFLLAGPDKKRFYANAKANYNFQLWCDQQGYKVLEFNRPTEIHATIFNRSGELLGRWNVELPSKQAALELYRAEKPWTFVRGFDIENDGALRITIGQTREPVESCGLSQHFLANNEVNFIELRAPK